MRLNFNNGIASPAGVAGLTSLLKKTKARTAALTPLQHPPTANHRAPPRPQWSRSIHVRVVWGAGGSNWNVPCPLRPVAHHDHWGFQHSLFITMRIYIAFYSIRWQSLRLQTVPGNGACLRRAHTCVFFRKATSNATIACRDRSASQAWTRTQASLSGGRTSPSSLAPLSTQTFVTQFSLVHTCRKQTAVMQERNFSLCLFEIHTRLLKKTGNVGCIGIVPRLNGNAIVWSNRMEAHPRTATAFGHRYDGSVAVATASSATTPVTVQDSAHATLLSREFTGRPVYS